MASPHTLAIEQHRAAIEHLTLLDETVSIPEIAAAMVPPRTRQWVHRLYTSGRLKPAYNGRDNPDAERQRPRFRREEVEHQLHEYTFNWDALED